MLNNLRQRGSDEGGFTLIELLVVILIIGILAAIAIPTFLSQKSKATDVQAKEAVQTARTAAETYATDHNGEYAGMSLTELGKYEPSLETTVSTTHAYVKYGSTIEEPTSDSYELVGVATDGDQYTIKSEAGKITRSCTITTGHEHSGCTVAEGATTGTW